MKKEIAYFATNNKISTFLPHLAILFAFSCSDTKETTNTPDVVIDGGQITDVDSGNGTDDDIFDSDMFDDDDDSDDTDTTDSDTEICDVWDIDIEVVPTRLMLLQDISSSMNDGEPDSKWVQAHGALTFILEQFGDSTTSRIEFGFDTFPNIAVQEVRCEMEDPVVVDAGPNTAQQIQTIIDALQISHSTPLYLGLEEFIDPNYAPSFLSDEVSSYLVIISDGADTCGTDGQSYATAEELGNMAAELYQNHNVMSIAIGFGADASPEQLNEIAQNGGTPYDQYIIAGDQTQLEEVLSEIAATVASCVYDIGEVDQSVDKNKVNFFFNGGDVQLKYDQDCQVGGLTWTWENAERTRVRFCDEACGMIQNGTVSDIYAEFGCDTVPIN